MLNEKDLLKIKSDIDQAKSKVSELTGKKKHLLQELKDKWGCSSIEEAEKMVKGLEREIKGLEIKVSTITEEIKEQYSI